jgi:two-component system NtrC family sensor kinase
MTLNIFRLKLRPKFIAATIITISIFGLINIFINRQYTSKALQKELDERSLFMGKVLSERIIILLFHEDWISLQYLLDEAKTNDSDLAYLFLINDQHRVMAHTFGSDYPVELLAANTLTGNTGYSFQMIEDEHGNVYRDIAFPLLDGRLGVLRLGIADKHLSAATNKIIGVLTGMVLAFLGVGIMGAIFFSSWITNPVSKITKAFETINLDEEFPPLQIKTKDEISLLASKFNEMAIRLQKAHTDLKKAQKSLVQAEKLASIGTFTSGLAHEISNPLAGLKNCLIRIEKDPNKEKIRRYFKLMMNAIQKIERVVTGLLDFSRRDAFQFRPVHLNRTIDSALSLLAYKLETNRIHVVKNLDRNLKDFAGDDQQIEQVIVNLVLNSLDAMPQGGELLISTALSNSTAYLKIEDTGEGIAPENIDNIFDPFFTTKEPGRGTGLGLSVSYNIIKEHGGNISVESKERQGTIFVISLPYTTIEKDR